MSTSKTFSNSEKSSCYVAFIDILGFGARVETNFEDAIAVYEQVLGSTEIINGMRQDVTMQTYSDAFLLTSRSLGSMIAVIQGLHMQSLFQDCLVRGGIGFGEHIESQIANNFFVVSQPLVRAVAVEKRIKYPCVGFHVSVEIPDKWWTADMPNQLRGILHFNGLSIVNPFNRYWSQSAMTRVAMMSAEHPEYSEKYDWFLSLYNAVIDETPLIP